MSNSLLKVRTHVLHDVPFARSAEDDLMQQVCAPALQSPPPRRDADAQPCHTAADKGALVRFSCPAQNTQCGENVTRAIAPSNKVGNPAFRSAHPTTGLAAITSKSKFAWRLMREPSSHSNAATKAALLDHSSYKFSVAQPGHAVLPGLMTRLNDVESLLYTLLPPTRTVCEETGETVMQCVSAEPPSRVEVAKLHERLLQQLQKRRARVRGICPIRREIYAELFDELIREVTLDEPSRGVLLLRVRDELYQSLAAHQQLAERAMLFTSKQRGDKNTELDKLRVRLKELEEERETWLVRRRAAAVREEQLTQMYNEEYATRTKQYQDEAMYFRRANRQVSQRIKVETERANAHGIHVEAVQLEAGELNSVGEMDACC
ncbi:putative Axonemal dynein light chain [Trypanosoma vivax]|uniref:Putative dynein light chain n=1 Tax=Trypanosoma vivax (strain Y486) TaxID=1055687 RepID=G0U890_TRYVY|nr:putative dynein light chain [Trypanosoma vivax]KAH8607246.1 putative Axonemal dynein light chain [Trypanosoma vivax]CCC52100.1 putative dynein light chain [Trypanosoma vivax Y486]